MSSNTSGPGKTIARFADVAMYEAEPTSVDGEQVSGPRVTLLYMTPDPLGSIAMASRMYEGKSCHDIHEITDAERDRYFNDILRTRLQAPFEFVDVHLLFENVDRGFTHQLVRQRTAVYVQESQRFAVKRNAALEVSQPPSIAGLKDDDPKRVLWDETTAKIAENYNALIDAGVPAEDARGLLPTNITTRVHYKTNLRALAEHAGNRLCTQAQFEWRQVWAGIINELKDRNTADRLAADGYHSVYRSADLADVFAPICFQSGRCQFEASMDRHCNIRERVQAYAEHGVKPGEWVDGRVDLGIPAIRPQDWLSPNAARRAPAQEQ